MKNIFTIIFLFVATSLSAQSLRWQTFQQSIDSAGVDTSWFALRSGIFRFDVDPDSVAIVPPENVEIDETPVATFRQVSGTAADSSITYAKPVVSYDGVAYIVQNDSVFVTGTSFAAPASANTFGDGRLYAKTLAFATKRLNGVIFITKIFDIAGGSPRKFEYGLGTK